MQLIFFMNKRNPPENSLEDFFLSVKEATLCLAAEGAQSSSDGSGEGSVLRGHEANTMKTGKQSEAVFRLGKV